MDTKNKIFSASFQQSLDYVNKLRSGSDSKEFVKNYFNKHKMVKTLAISIMALLIWGTLCYALGIGMPQEFAKAQIGSINDINYCSAVMAGKIGSYLTVVPQVFVFLWTITWIYFLLIRMFPRYSVKKAMQIGMVQLVLLASSLFAAFFPLAVGFAISGSGILGMIGQVLLVIYFLRKSIIYTRNRILFELYKTEEKMKKRGSLKILFVVFVLLIINSYFPRIGMITPVDSYQILYGWCFLIISIITIFFKTEMVIPQLVVYYYIIKYSESYRKIWEITDEQWYGKRRAKRIARRNKNKREEIK